MIKFDSQYHLFDVTPIENIFIQQYLVKSPGDYVKVYIYCLNGCYFPDGENVSFESIAQALKLSEDDVRRAVRYWTRLGIMSTEENTEDKTLEIEMHSMKDMFFRCDFSDNVDLYHFKEFNAQLTEAFAPRILDTQDYLLYQDMMNIYRVNEDYVLEAVKYSIKATKSVDVTYKYVEKVIESWRNAGLDSIEKIRRHIEKNDASYRGICAILRYLGMNRMPTMPELNCYKKWTDEYHFDHDAIKEACNQTLSANAPTIKYLDSILTSLHEKNISTATEITEEKDNAENYRNKVRKLLYYLGLRGAPSAVQTQKYKKWERDYGFDEDAISVAASLITETKRPFDSLDAILESFYMKGITDTEGMLTYVNEKKKYDDGIKEIKSIIGSKEIISDSERELMRRWHEESNIADDIIKYAASISASAEKPWAYMNTVLTTWAKNGVKTRDEAERFNNTKSSGDKANTKPEKKYSFTNIDKHEYSESDYGNMFDNFGDFDNK